MLCGPAAPALAVTTPYSTVLYLQFRLRTVVDVAKVDNRVFTHQKTLFFFIATRSFSNADNYKNEINALCGVNSIRYKFPRLHAHLFV